MANIMLTYRCNLKCPYCFANEFVNNQKVDISSDNFDKAVSFIKTSSKHVGLIGGEPALHPLFKSFLERLIFEKEIEAVTIYTNGVALLPFINQIIHPKFHLLVNCNSPTDIGKSNYERLVSNLDLLINNYYLKERITLGINLYADNLDFDFILQLLQRYEYCNLRISLTVPSTLTAKKHNVLDFFLARKPFLLNFLKKLEDINVLPHFDCNIPPACIWTTDEKRYIEKTLVDNGVKKHNLLGTHLPCSPVVDILPDLRAVRCFGLSEFIKADINDFKTLADIVMFFRLQVDANASNISIAKECGNCYEKICGHCTCGCLVFKQEFIKNISDYISSLCVP